MLAACEASVARASLDEARDICQRQKERSNVKKKVSENPLKASPWAAFFFLLQSALRVVRALLLFSAPSFLAFFFFFRFLGGQSLSALLRG